jgi:hypothetical protein
VLGLPYAMSWLGKQQLTPTAQPAEALRSYSAPRSSMLVAVVLRPDGGFRHCWTSSPACKHLLLTKLTKSVILCPHAL